MINPATRCLELAPRVMEQLPYYPLTKFEPAFMHKTRDSQQLFHEGTQAIELERFGSGLLRCSVARKYSYVTV
jgi:hypothetical protein